VVALGDTVTWGDHATGQVVVMIADGIAMPGHVAEQWAFLERGYMLWVEGAGYIHYEECEKGAELLSRLTGAVSPPGE
jgi:hypothetical protein